MYNPDNVEMVGSSLVERKYIQKDHELIENEYKVESMKNDITRYLNTLPLIYKTEVFQYLKDNYGLKEITKGSNGVNSSFGTINNTSDELEDVLTMLSNLMSWPLELRKKFEIAKKENKLLDLKSTRLAIIKTDLSIEEAKESMESLRQRIKRTSADLKLLKLIHNITIKEQKKAKENKG